MPPVSYGITRPDLEQNAGNWVREVKPLMRHGKHSSDVCLPLPNLPATFGQHFKLLSPRARLPSPYSACITLWLCRSTLHYGFNSKFFSLCTYTSSIRSLTPVSVVCRIVTAETECEMGCWNRNHTRTETAFQVKFRRQNRNRISVGL